MRAQKPNIHWMTKEFAKLDGMPAVNFEEPSKGDLERVCLVAFEIKEENKRLRETLEGLESLQYQTPNNREAAYNKGVLDCINRFKKALSSGGE